MNRVSVSSASAVFVKSLLVASLALGSMAGAAEAQRPAKPDPAKGATLYDSGDTARGLPACLSCHGAAGNSTIAVNPKLSNQIEAYTHKQLVDFTTPQRVNPVMTTYAKMLTDEEKRNVAAYLATQKVKPGAAKNKDTIELGRKIYRGGIAEKGVAACASCHGAAAGGIPVQYPRLAGQHQDYTTAQLVAFRTGARSNSPQMTTLAQRLSDTEMKAVADYIAGLR
ncbi:MULTISPECIES: cytochrome c [unclassified Massilia]|uniref:c-type cytochrome n=1 Tax=unclassified Massilia TaxID=2609279 RepID=UPI00177B6B30|nr:MULTISPECIES: c-type cytochrome [unclassified Massilia]MBD8533332.1 cytochrome c4 [Massilia sp. CFBP 13647]MBD8676709.1 cytochrome c4 [Massilia sp. CFBP 13721]